MNKKQFEWVLDKGLDFNQWIVLYSIHKKIGIINTDRINGWFNILSKKQFLSHGELTEKAENYLSEFHSLEEEKEKTSFNFDRWCLDLHTTLVSVIGTEMKNPKIKNYTNPSGKKLLCSPKELEIRLKEFEKKFKNKDWEKVEKTLIHYTKRVIRGMVPYAQALIYFIWNTKQGGIESPLLTWMEDIDEKEEMVDIVTTKKSDLF